MEGAEVKTRPLSPHLGIYRPQITSVLSILHRISGLFLYVGLLIFSWKIIFSNFSDFGLAESYLHVTELFFGSIIGKFALFVWVLAFYYHFCNGIRHLVWDAGYGFSINSVKTSGIVVIVISVTLTVFSWFNGISNLIN